MKMVPLDRQRLSEHGVTLLKDGACWRLVCQECGHSWPVPKHIIHRDYWICPQNHCNIAKPEPVEDWPAPKPAPEPEPEEDPLEKAISEALAGYNLYQKKLRSAQTDEETEAHRRKSEEFLDEYLGLVEERSAGDPPEPKTDEQRRIEEALDRYLGGKGD